MYGIVLRLLACVMMIAGAGAAADGPGRAESTVLYSYSHSDSPDGRDSFHGHRTDLTWFKNRRFGLGATLINSQSYNTDLLFGPEFAVAEKGRFGVRAHARAGRVQRLLQDERGNQSSRWRAAVASGASLDVDVFEGWIWGIQPEVVWWNGNRRRTDLRISTGLVVRWGKVH